MADILSKAKNEARRRRQRRVRAKIHGTAERPRLNVFRSNENIFAQLINDDLGHTIVSASTIDKELASKVDGKTKTDAAKIVGQELGERAKKAGIEAVVFDRAGFQYHGRVAALADGARDAGLKF
jgi:large subunit ribosomal protein L18